MDGRRSFHAIILDIRSSCVLFLQRTAVHPRSSLGMASTVSLNVSGPIHLQPSHQSICVFANLNLRVSPVKSCSLTNSWGTMEISALDSKVIGTNQELTEAMTSFSCKHCILWELIMIFITFFLRLLGHCGLLWPTSLQLKHTMGFVLEIQVC